MLLCTTKCCSSTTKCDSSTTLYYKVLLQHYCTTKCYSRATLYYKLLLQHHKVLLQYYSALQSTTPVLLCPLLQHYKVPLQHYSEYCVLQSATPVLPCSATPVALLKWSEWERRGAGTPALPSAGAPGPRHSRAAGPRDPGTPGAPLRRGSSCARSSNRLCQSRGTTEPSRDSSPWRPACEAGCDTTTPTAL